MKQITNTTMTPYKNYNEQALSVCCKAPLMTSTGSEGTSCYICRKCNKASDPFPKQPKGEKCIECGGTKFSRAFTAEKYLDYDCCNNCGRPKQPIVMKTLAQLIKSKKLDCVDSDITEDNFPAPKEIRTDFKLFHFDRIISSEDAVKEMEKEGYNPANIYELLSWEGWNGNDFVVALGSAPDIDGDRYVPYLHGNNYERYLYLVRLSHGWSAYYSFLGVRKMSSASRTLEPALGVSDALTLGNFIRELKNLIEKYEK